MTSALGFKARVDLFLHASSPMEIFRFASDATPADYIEVSMAAERFGPGLVSPELAKYYFWSFQFIELLGIVSYNLCFFKKNWRT